MIAKKKPRRRRKSRYKRGTYVSIKSGQPCKYRSGWELFYLQHLDANVAVKTFTYEPFKIPYVSAVRSGKIRNYIPDVIVEMIDGSLNLIEIKPKRKLVQSIIKKKLAAAEEYCRAHGMTLVILTEVELKLLGMAK